MDSVGEISGDGDYENDLLDVGYLLGELAYRFGKNADDKFSLKKTLMDEFEQQYSSGFPAEEQSVG